MSTTRFIPSLTPLRGIAAILVVFFHYHMLIGPLTTPEIYVISKLYLMVDLFFVLSGFILSHVYQEWFEQKIDKPRFWEFLKARLARIYPLHVLTFLYLLVWVIYMRSQIDFDQTPVVVQKVLDNSSIPGVLTLTHAWGTHRVATWNTASWSISIEWFLYIIFPFFTWIIYRYQRPAKIVLAFLACFSLVYLCYVIEPVWIEEVRKQLQYTEEQMTYYPKNSIDIVTGFALLRGFCGFILGMITYGLFNQKLGREILKKGFWFLLLWAGLFILWYKDSLPDFLTVPIFALLVLHTAYVEGITRKILNSKILTYLGDISYSIYMVHIPIILTLFILSLIGGEMPQPPEEINFAQNWVGSIILLLIVIIVASITHKFVEKPARRKLKRL